jgi:hypothetical protein
MGGIMTYTPEMPSPRAARTRVEPPCTSPSNADLHQEAAALPDLNSEYTYMNPRKYDDMRCGCKAAEVPVGRAQAR